MQRDTMHTAAEVHEKAPLPRKLIKRLQQHPQQTAWAIAEQEWDVGYPVLPCIADSMLCLKHRICLIACC